MTKKLPYHRLNTFKVMSILLSFGMVSTFATAQNIYVNDMSLKSELNWLNSQGVIQISTSTWPLTANEIKRALSLAKVKTSEQEQIVQSIQLTLKQKPKSLVNAQVGLYAQTDRQRLPQTFADNKMSTVQASLQAGISEEDWEFNLQANLKDDDLINDDDVSFEGSYVAGKFANQWLIAGQIPTWWGPGNDGSLIRGDASLPVMGLTLQRDEQDAPTSPYLSWVGPWQYQLFAGQLDDYEAVPDAKLFGARLTASPWPWLEVGASRTFMWGGEGRPESFSSFGDALLGTKDNDTTTGNTDQDPANQLAGFDARVNLMPLVGLPTGIYAQYIGEDEAGGLPAKNMYLAGIDYASNMNDLPYQLYAEYTDTRSSGEVRGVSYDHFLYTDGYYQHGYPLGYGLGGDAESVALGGKLWVDNKNFITTKLQYAKVNQSNESDNQAFPEPETLKVADIAWEHQMNQKTLISSRVWALDSNKQSTDMGAGVGLEFTNF